MRIIKIMDGQKMILSGEHWGATEKIINHINKNKLNDKITLAKFTAANVLGLVGNWLTGRKGVDSLIGKPTLTRTEYSDIDIIISDNDSDLELRLPRPCYVSHKYEGEYDYTIVNGIRCTSEEQTILDVLGDGLLTQDMTKAEMLAVYMYRHNSLSKIMLAANSTQRADLDMIYDSAKALYERLKGND